LYRNLNIKFFMKLEKQSEDWINMSEDDRESIVNLFLDKGKAHLICEYSKMSNKEVVEKTIQLRRESEILSIKNYVFSIIIFLGENNRYDSSFLNCLNAFATLSLGSALFFGAPVAVV